MFDGINLFKCSNKDIRKIRGNRISIIFQDPMTSLNPYLTIGVQLTEPLLAHQNISVKKARIKAIDLLYEVGFQDAEKFMNQYPHVLSGGMSQRVVIAMALITGPELLIADEPTTALDVTIQAQILDLIKKMQETRNMAVIFITHDLGVIAGMADRVIVMYAGKLMESGKVHDIFYNPAHPYTRALIDSIPAFCKPGGKLYAIPGMPPDLLQPISGCSFAPRCKDAEDKCFCTSCRIKEISPDHYSACLKIQV
jgi:oligopeptide transport system ATP-binding protein